MPIFDASSIVHGWDTYPIDIFPPMWDWLAAEVQTERIILPAVAFREVQDVSPDCADWLRDNDVKRIATRNAELQEAKRIKGLLGIVDDAYHPNGVDENDLIIISSASIARGTLVSNELQPTAPANRTKYKIPSVCRLPAVRVDCIEFLDFIRQSGQVFR